MSRAGLAGLSVTLVAGLAAAQSPPPTPPPLRLEVGVEVVSITAVVHDRAGRFVSGLGPADIEVYEDGVRQKVSHFQEVSDPSAEKIPLSIVLVLDASGSMRPRMPFLQEAALTFVHKLEEVDRALVVDFNSGVRGSKEFTGDVSRLEQFVESLQAWGGTSLYDAVHYALQRVRDQPGRKALIVFSDGADTTSSMSEDEVIDYARSVEATTYAIGFRGDSGLFARGPRGFLRKIARETGGSFFFPERLGDLIRIFEGVSDELHHHYLLAYAPARPADGTWRAIEVRLRRKETEIRVRKGYFAVRRPRAG
ncbi:MAG TPA: VWA domain-containing protein [Vicinamibacteria bacterium]